MFKHHTLRGVWLILLVAVVLVACGTPTPAPTQEPDEVDPTDEVEGTAEPTDESPSDPEAPVASDGSLAQISGNIEVSNDLILAVYFYERFVYLEDLTGFINRDYEYEQPLEAQIFGPVTVGEDGAFNYTINLPAQPVSPLNDVDQDGTDETGVQVWQLVMGTNLFEDPFLGDDETGGWSTVYTSGKIDSENKDEIKGGMILVWAPDGDQAFPTGFGDDGLLFTEDDPTGPIAPGYTLVNMDSESFTFSQESADVTLYEGDIIVNDLSEMSWAEGFDALFEKASREYPFTEMKGVDWDALYEEFAPRIAEAEADNDEEAYYLALRDFSWSIPDGHVGLGGDDFGMFQAETAGGYGMALADTDDGRVIVAYVVEGGAAEAAGIQWGAEVTAWNGTPINEAVAAVIPWSSPFSTGESERLQQLRYLLRTTAGGTAEVTFTNPNGAEQTVALESTDETESFTRTSFYYGFNPTGLPVEFEILDSGYGYVAIYSFSDELNLTLRLYERAIQSFIEAGVPGVIVDLRQNSGGAPVGNYLAGFFTQDTIEVTRDFYFSDLTGQLETFRPVSTIEPNDDFYYDGNIAVLVSPACASACEDAAYMIGLLEQTRVIGYHATLGIYGEVGRGQYELPGGYSFQIPTGLTQDMEGNIIIEGTGVVPDVRVPRTEETLRRDYIDGEDVVLNFAIETLDKPIGAGVTPSGPPSIDGSGDLVALIQANTTILTDLAREEYEDPDASQPGVTNVYTIPMSVGSSRVDLQACKLEYSIVSPK